MASRFRRRALGCLCALVGLSAGFLGSEALFGESSSSVTGAVLLFSVELRDEAGALLASPLLVGEEGRKLHLDLDRPLGRHSEPLRMSLDLDPRSSGSRNLCVGYKISLSEDEPRVGRIGLAPGEPRSIHLPGPGEPLQLRLVVARAGSAEFSRILRDRRVRLG
ncbi:MAG: hypothetical protein ACJ79D_11945 [Myxococcales bacterium]